MSYKVHLPQHGLVKAPISSIVLVDELIRPRQSSFRSVSPPGHLIHYVESGRVEQIADGRREVFGRGDFIWYHETEAAEGVILEAPWRFITVNFIAPLLSPPPDDFRVFSATARTRKQIRKLRDLWKHGVEMSTPQTMRAFALLNELVADLHQVVGMAAAPDVRASSSDRWWLLEKRVRLRLAEVHSAAELARMGGMSIRTMVRSCLAATGLPPARRIKALRIAHAHHLLQLTDLTITEIAMEVGYERVQELSRDIRKHLGRTPREIRAATPDYKQLQRSTSPGMVWKTGPLIRRREN